MERSGRREIERQFEQVWQEYGPSLSRLTASYEALPQAREDLLQEISLAIWNALPNFRGECSMRTFVYRIAHNRSLTHALRKKELQTPEESLEIPDPKANPEASAIEGLNRAKLMTAIRELPISFRQVITMTLEELPQSEIATVLGISENNVAVRLLRARKMLREKLGGAQ